MTKHDDLILSRVYFIAGPLTILSAVFFPVVAGVGLAWWPVSLFCAVMGAAYIAFGFVVRRWGQ